MRRFSTSLIAASIAGLLSGVGLAAPRPLVELRVRPDAVVAGPTVTVRDVAEVKSPHQRLAAAIGRVSVGNSPQPGVVRDITPKLVWRRLADVGIAAGEVQIVGQDTCRVKLDSVVVSGSDIAQAAIDWLKSQLGADRREWTFEVSRPPKSQHVRKGSIGFRVKNRSLESIVGNATVFVEVLIDGEVGHTVSVYVEATCIDEVLVAAKRIARHEPFRPSSVRRERRRITTLTRRYLPDLDQLNGKSAGRSIAEGEIITEDACLLLPCIRRGQAVTAFLKTDQMQIGTECVACQEGRVGDTIQLENPRTKTKVVGKVVSGSLVQVALRTRGQ